MVGSEKPPDGNPAAPTKSVHDTNHRDPTTDIPLIGVPALDLDGYAGLAGEVVDTLAPHTESSREALLLTALAMFGNAVGFGPRMYVDGSWHRPKLYVVICGSTSRSRKGTSLSNVSRVFEEADPIWFEDAISSGLASGEGIVKARQTGREDKNGDPIPDPDPRLFVIEAEFARILSVIRREGSTLSTILRDWYDRDVVEVKTRRDPLKGKALLSVLAHVTVEELQRELTFSDMLNGFGNRFLFAVVERSQKLPWGGRLSDDKLDEIAGKVRKALSAARQVDEIGWSPEAKELWAGFYMQLSDDIRGPVGAMTARTEAHLLRLAMTFALMDSDDTIRPTHLYAAAAVWDYCARSVVHIFDAATGDPVADRLYDAIVESGVDGLDETAQSAVFGRHQPAHRLRAARKTLTDTGLVVAVTEATEGRSRTVYRVANKANLRSIALQVPGTPGGKGVHDMFRTVQTALYSPDSSDSPTPNTESDM